MNTLSTISNGGNSIDVFSPIDSLFTEIILQKTLSVKRLYCENGPLKDGFLSNKYGHLLYKYKNKSMKVVSIKIRLNMRREIYSHIGNVP